MIVKEPVHIDLNILPSVLQYPAEKYTASVFLGGEYLNNTYVSRDSRDILPVGSTFIISKYIHPFGISNPNISVILESHYLITPSDF